MIGEENCWRAYRVPWLKKLEAERSGICPCMSYGSLNRVSKIQGMGCGIERFAQPPLGLRSEYWI
jgi:hypothetical protein